MLSLQRQWLRRVAVLEGVIEFKKDRATSARLEAIPKFVKVLIVIKSVQVGAEVVAKIEFRADVLWIVRPERATGVVNCPCAEVLVQVRGLWPSA